jgi:hypothetical protein
MLVLAFELFWLVVGIATLITGRISVFGHWIIEGVAARFVGLLLVAPVAVPFVLGFMRGMEAGRTGKQLSLEDLQDLGLLEMGLWVGCFALAGIVALIAARKPGKEVDPEEEWKRLRASGQLETDSLHDQNPLRRR